MNFVTRFSYILILLITFSLLSAFISGCTTETRLLNKIPVNSIEVEVLDQNDDPISGAQVEASNGRQTTTNEDGIAKIRFGGVGVHSVTVLTDNHMPNNFIVTMPTDNGMSKTLRLTDTVEFTGVSFGSANLYPLMFNYLFSSYGYGLELNDYQEGEWTTWNIHTAEGDDPMRISKGFLKQLDNGQQWWQVVLNQANEENDTYTAEVLFSEDRSSVLRYREKIGDGDIQEKPVSEGWYSQPTELTEESRKAAIKNENIEVTIPKGTFRADLIEFGVAPETTLNIWQATNEDIPGGVLKYETQSEEELLYNSELQDYGNGATTKLESY